MHADDEQERLRYAANFPKRANGWSFETFPATPETSWVRDALRAWAAQEPPAVPGVVLCGDPGLGKTGLALAALAELLPERVSGPWMTFANAGVVLQTRQRGLRKTPAPVWFESWADIETRLRASFDARKGPSEYQLLRELTEVRALVVDDADVGRTSPWKESVLKRLVERAEHGRRTILTLNSAPADLLDVLGERVADRLCDRKLWAVFSWGGRSLRQT